MKLLFCVICGTNKDLQHHHVIPIAVGGEDCEHNIITLCSTHHDLIHGIHRIRSMSFSDLVKLGQKKSGNYGGRPSLSQNNIDDIINLWKNGHSYRQIRSMTGCSLASIQKYVNKYSETIDHV